QDRPVAVATGARSAPHVLDGVVPRKSSPAVCRLGVSATRSRNRTYQESILFALGAVCSRPQRVKPAHRSGFGLVRVDVHNLVVRGMVLAPSNAWGGWPGAAHDAGPLDTVHLLFVVAATR